MLKTVFHIGDSIKWELVLMNAKNLMAYCKESGQEYEIEIVANSEAVKGLVASAMEEKNLHALLREVQGAGVIVAACRNALRKFDIVEAMLPENVLVVPAGVGELTLKQQAGFAYIKA